MVKSCLKFSRKPELSDGRMLLAFTGWMDGGDVSTGTVRLLIEKLEARRIARIEPDPFYIFNFPGAMEVTALFRPHVRIEDGVVKSLDMPANEFYVSIENNLLLFVGKEPNLRWVEFGDCVFKTAEETGVREIIFVGSFAGSVPHTREPRLYATVSDPSLMPLLERYGVRPSDYEGPGSFASYLTTRASKHGIQMTSLVAEIPGYVEGTNPPSIAAITKRLATMLGLQITLAELRGESDEWESRVSAAVAKDADLEQQIKKLEEQYDDELIGGAEES